MQVFSKKFGHKREYFPGRVSQRKTKIGHKPPECVQFSLERRLLPDGLKAIVPEMTEIPSSLHNTEKVRGIYLFRNLCRGVYIVLYEGYQKSVPARQAALPEQLVKLLEITWIGFVCEGEIEYLAEPHSNPAGMLEYMSGEHQQFGLRSA